MKLIKPHGGILINREAQTDEREGWARGANELPRVQLSKREVSDLEMIATGAFSPLEGFLTRADYEAVRDTARLADGTVWSLPVTLSVSAAKAAELRENSDVALYRDDDLLAVLHLDEKFVYDKQLEARRVFRTTDDKHPGVAALYAQGEVLLGGKVTLLSYSRQTSFAEYRHTPEQTRQLFQNLGWRRVVAFQTRNPVHRAHEYIQKCALEIADGLLLHPLVGETKADDIPADVRIKSYEAILKDYYPKDRAILSLFPAAMRYAGPREAVFHALVRKNYGCSHFIVGRDHAGVGNYYGSYDAHHIFDEFEPEELGLTPLFFDHTFYCRKCAAMASAKTCPHDHAAHVTLSGTRVRELLSAGELPPLEFSRPEVAQILINAERAKKEVSSSKFQVPSAGK